MKKVIFILLFSFFISLNSNNCFASIEELFQQVDSSFMYKDKPIHPGLINEFNCWLSDSGVVTVGLDLFSLEHADNEYYDDDVSVEEGGFITVDLKEGEYFSYKWLGKLDNGLHVIEGWQGGGGSGIYMDLFFIKFEIEREKSFNGKTVERLLMKLIDRVGLGDRYDGKLTIESNKIILGASRYEGERVLNF